MKDGQKSLGHKFTRTTQESLKLSYRGKENLGQKGRGTQFKYTRKGKKMRCTWAGKLSIQAET